MKTLERIKTFIDGGPGSGPQGGRKDPIKSSSPKEFNSAVLNLYQEQKVEDWQNDEYGDNGMGARGYFGNQQSFKINEGLRTGKASDSRVKKATERFSKSFEKSSVEIPEGSNFYRAVDGNFADQISNMVVGSSFIDEGYFSSAGTKIATKNFGKVLMNIITGSNLKAMIYKDETEVLFSPGRTITIGKSRQSGGKTVIDVRLD